MQNSGLIGLALVVVFIFGGVFLFKKSIRAFFSMQTKHQAIGVAVISLGLALITPAGFVNSLIAWSILTYGFWTYVQLKVGGFKGGSGGGSGDVVRGNQLYDVKAVQKMVKNEESNIFIGEVAIPKAYEPSHFLLVGSTGTGKSQTFHQILGPVREKGERAIVADIGGEFAARYFKVGDAILNPFDKRSVDWSPLAEMRGEWDGDRIAKSIIPDGSGSSAEWNGYAQTLLSSVLVKAWENDAKNGDILRLLTRAPQSELKAYVEGMPAEGLFGEGSERMLSNILGIISSYIKSFQYLDADAGVDSFSIRGWVAKEGSSWLFLNVTDSQLASLKPVIAAALDIAISGLLELKPNADRRVWVAIDEFATFGYINSLEALLTKGRKYGGSAILGMQGISQPRESYGRDKAQTLLSCLGTQLVLRCPDGETAEYFSTHFGSQDIQRINHSTSHSGSDVNHSQSVQYATQRVVLASEIQQLPNLVGLLNIVGDIPPCVVNIPVSKGVEVAERFEAKPRKAKAENEAEQVAE